MKWKSIEGFPGLSVYHAESGPRTYKAQHKDGAPLWRLFVKEDVSQAFRTIFTGNLLRECKDYAEIFEESFK